MTEPQIIELHAATEGFPTLTDTLMIKVPTFYDFRQARQRYPYRLKESDPEVPYSSEELLVAMSFIGVNGNKFQEGARDVMDRLRTLGIADRQYLNLIFKEAFLLTEEVAKDARSFATNVMFNMPPSLSYTIPASSLPSKSSSLTFSRPNTGTQFDADRLHKGVPTHGCTFEEYLFACCLTEVDGKPVDRGHDTITVLDPMGVDDVGFAVTVFINMFVLDDSGSEKAKKSGLALKDKRFAKPTGIPTKGTAVKATAS